MISSQPLRLVAATTGAILNNGYMGYMRLAGKKSMTGCSAIIFRALNYAFITKM